MRRRHFFSRLALGAGACNAQGWLQAQELSPTDLRPPIPIGQAMPSREIDAANVSRCRVVNPSAVKILQLTDLHFYCDRDRYGEKADQQTKEDIRRLVALHEPDVVAFTGDVWHDPNQGMSEEIFAYALDAMTSLGVPWLFIWGNHDLLEDYGKAQVALTEAPKSLYRGGHAGGNYRVVLENADGEALHDLICLNTTTQGVQAAQEKWLRETLKVTGRSENAFGFLHIPLKQYIDSWTGKGAKGVQNEEVCTYGEDGSAFPLLADLGVKACFCGHDHVNDYMGTYEGMNLVYGRATGHAGYGGDRVRKGGKLITLDAIKGASTWQTVFADGQTWTP